ncbi:MAG: hypothetical protein L0312_32935, partial [Acidobacteria bacterium]|nr:hypothetical protein [Acidobacteriota bacterium]
CGGGEVMTPAVRSIVREWFDENYPECAYDPMFKLLEDKIEKAITAACAKHRRALAKALVLGAERWPFSHIDELAEKHFETWNEIRCLADAIEATDEDPGTGA